MYVRMYLCIYLYVCIFLLYTACSITSCNTTCLETSLCTCIQYLHFSLIVHIDAVAVHILFCFFWSDLQTFVVLFEASCLTIERKRNTLILHGFDLLQLFIVDRVCEMSDLFKYLFTNSLFLTGQLSSFEICAISFPLSVFSLLQSYSRWSTVWLPLAQGHSGDSYYFESMEMWSCFTVGC
jgi:hypothetical protein